MGLNSHAGLIKRMNNVELNTHLRKKGVISIARSDEKAMVILHMLCKRNTAMLGNAGPISLRLANHRKKNVRDERIKFPIKSKGALYRAHLLPTSYQKNND